MSGQVLVKPQGIINEPNKVGQYTPGAAVNMTNVAIRSFGLMESVQKWRQLGVAFGNGAVMAGGGAYIRTDGRTTILLKQTGTSAWRIYIYDALNNVTLVFGVITPFNSGYLSSTGRTGIVLFRNRLIIAGTKGSFVYDLYYDSLGNGSVANNGTPRFCGVAQPTITSRSSTGGTGTSPDQYLPANMHFNATSVLRMLHNDGYELLSVPAFPVDYPNLSTTFADFGSRWYLYGDQGTYSDSHWTFTHDIFRTRNQSVGYDSGANSYSPVSCGSSFYTCKSIANATVTSTFIKENTLPNQLGEALYVNNAASGAAAIATPPPPAKCAAAFRGHVFYANKFDPATFKLLTPYFWGGMFSSGVQSENGIGTRYQNGRTSTNGSPNITLASTTGIVVGQYIFVSNSSTGASVANGVINAVNTTTKVVTMSVNANFSGTVDVEMTDVIELNGFKFTAGFGPSNFARLVNSYFLMDTYSVGLEPQRSYDAGVYPFNGASGGMTFRMRNTDPITLRATNGENYSTFIPDLSAATPLTIPGKQQDNGFAWSENNQPEYVPPANYAFVGNGEIYQIVPTRDALWFWCSDGLYRLSGSGGSVGDGYDWVIDPVDPGLFLASVNAVCVHREYVYAFTNRGLVSVSSEGVIRELSDGRVNSSQSDNLFNDITLRNRPWVDSTIVPTSGNSTNIWLCADARTDDILLRSNINSLGLVWAYNTKTDTFTCRRPSAMGDVPIVAAYNSTLQEIIGLDRATGEVFGSNGTGFETWEIELQPIYGTTASKTAYTKKHWQDVNFSFKTPVELASVSLTVRFGSGATLTNETRVIPTVGRAVNGNTAFPDNARVGFTVPRIAPAIGNALKLTIVISGGNLGTATDAADTLVLEGIEVNFIDFSDERILR